MQVREYGCPVVAKVEGVNWTFGRGRAVGETMQNPHHILYVLHTSEILPEVTILPPILMKNELLVEMFLMYCCFKNGMTVASQT